MFIQFQKMSELIQQISDRKSISAELIVLMFKGRIIRETESPKSIDYTQGLVISM